MIGGIQTKDAEQAVELAVSMRNEPVVMAEDYADTNVSVKVVKLIQSYTNIVNKALWMKWVRSFYCMNKRKWMIGIGIISLTLLYIWSNSLPPVEQSNRQSGKILRLIEIAFNTPPLDTEENQHVIRKIAHVAEFGLLGFEMALLLLINGTMRWQNMMNILFVGLAAATVDETIQIFVQRGSLVSDIVLDFGGVLLGIGFGFIVNVLVLRVKRNMLRKKEPKLTVT